jgi:hypothetical protein
MIIVDFRDRRSSRKPASTPVSPNPIAKTVVRNPPYARLRWNSAFTAVTRLENTLRSIEFTT